jgi:hypothetical protein
LLGLSPRVSVMHDIGELTERLRDFAAARDWEQFHTPKNLVMALAGEAGELLAENERRYDVATYRGSRTKAPASVDVNPAIATDRIRDAM